ncbi:MAG: allantoicase, partial [Gemmatimonadaceae bacterium]
MTNVNDFTDLPDLASERFGTVAVVANDEFFAPKERLIKSAPPEWREGVYDDHGKWMDGWETRRRRSPGYDWVIVRLGLAGVVRGVVIDTSFFTGNYPPHASIDATDVVGAPSAETLTSDATKWRPLLERVELHGNAKNDFIVDDGARRVTHLRLNIFPDGGVA